MKKPKVAIFGLTGCAGCQLTIYFIQDHLLELLSKIDLVAAPMIQSNNSKGPYDICFVEGSVTSDEDLRKIKELREKSKVIVSFGACASFGNVQSTKEYLDDPKKVTKFVYPKRRDLDKTVSRPLHEVISVDHTIPGCPPVKEDFIGMMEELLLNKKPLKYNKPVCYECNIKENNCLLQAGKECVGPITNGGCDALCPSNNAGCTGCRGPVEDLTFKAFKDLYKEIGITNNLFKSKVSKYSPKQIKERGYENVS